MDTALKLTNGKPEEVLGKVIYEKDLRDVNGEVASMPLEVIGVVENAPFRLVSDSVETELYLLQPPAAVRPLVRISGRNIAAGLAHLDATWESVGARQPIRRSFMDQRFDRAYSFFAAMGKTFTGLSLIALVISCSGLIAMTSYVIQKRRNEIAIRKVLGAHDKQIFTMLLSEMSRPIVVANLLAWPLAYWAMGQYFAQFVDKPSGVFWVYPAALLVCVGIAWLAIAVQLGSTRRIKPALLLRYQ
jgi:putative ABC transport system permease protein